VWHCPVKQHHRVTQGQGPRGAQAEPQSQSTAVKCRTDERREECYHGRGQQRSQQSGRSMSQAKPLDSSAWRPTYTTVCWRHPMCVPEVNSIKEGVACCKLSTPSAVTTRGAWLGGCCRGVVAQPWLHQQLQLTVLLSCCRQHPARTQTHSCIHLSWVRCTHSDQRSSCIVGRQTLPWGPGGSAQQLV